MNKDIMNKVILGDCLDVMKTLSNESINLIYLDPPFFTGKTQKRKSGPGAIEMVFEDSKDFWGDAEKIKKMRNNASEWLIYIANKQPQLASYLFYMAERLKECHRILNETGSLYLHCDYRTSHYLKLILDEIFGYDNFQRELIWDTSPLNIAGFKTKANNWIRAHDTLLFYTKNIDLNNCVFNKQWKDRYNKEKYIKTHYKFQNEKGIYRIKKNGEKAYLSDDKGEPVSDVWKDILSFNYVAAARQSVGYPTQKPKNLLERIIKASSNENDIVLDPFCGSGTTIMVAHNLNRRWIGIDISEDAIKVAKTRMR